MNQTIKSKKFALRLYVSPVSFSISAVVLAAVLTLHSSSVYSAQDQLAFESERFDEMSKFAELDRTAISENGEYLTIRVGRWVDEKFSALYTASDFGQGLESANDEVLELRFKVASLAVFSTHKSEYLGFLESTFEELKRRNSAKPEHYREMAQHYIRLREFEKATGLFPKDWENLAQYVPTTFSEDETLGKVTGPESRPVWRLEDKAHFVDSVVDLSGRKIVVSFSATCAVSLEARRDLLSDPEISSIIENHTLWLIPPAGNLSLGAVREWNDEPGAPELVYTHRRTDWPEFRSWGTPSFHFYENGELIDVKVGWSDLEKFKTELRELKFL